METLSAAADLTLSDATRAIRTPKLWIFDMDDTLYCASAGMFDAIHEKMRHFIADALGVSVEEGERLQHAYWERYGTTFLGLEKHHGIRPEAFLAAAHDFNVERLAKTRVDARHLRAILTRLPGRKMVFTNGPGFYAKRILRTLHIEDCFDDVMASTDMHVLGAWRCKPDPMLLTAAARRMKTAPRDCVLIEDSLRNLKGARGLGMQTVWCVGNARSHSVAERPAYVDAVIRTAKDLPRLVAAKVVKQRQPVDGRYH